MEWLRDHLWESWLSVAILLTIAEMFSLELFLIMLASGAIVGMALALLGAPFAAQALAAGCVALGMLLVVRKPVVERLHRGPDVAMGTTRLLGQRAVVTAEISGAAPGLIKLDGESWTAATDSDGVLRPGDAVEVDRIDGATAYVRPAT